VAGRHRKPTPLAFKIKTAGGVVAGAAIAGTIAASAAAATANTTTVSASMAPIEKAGDAKRKSVANTTSVDERKAASRRTKAQAEEPAKDKAPKREKQDVPEVTAEEAIKLAKSQLGESEDDSGETKFNKWFVSDPRALVPLRRDGGDLSGYKYGAWCSMFISWIGNRLGISDQMGFDAWTPKHAEWFKDNGRWGTTPKPGAVTFFAWSGSKDVYDINHVGLTIKDNGDGTIETIEGNTDNRVAIRERDKSDVVGYGYPDYAK
jgi:hypothetical protein